MKELKYLLLIFVLTGFDRLLNAAAHYAPSVSSSSSASENPYNQLFFKAVIDGKYEIVKNLLESKKVDVNVRNSDGFTALMLASNIGNVNIVKLLLAHNADVNTKNDEGVTALLVAANPQIEQLLERHLPSLPKMTHEMVPPTSLERVHPTYKKYFYDCQKKRNEILKIYPENITQIIHDFNCISYDQWLENQQILFNSIEANDIETIKSLINEVNVNAQDLNGKTPLIRASELGRTEIVKLLLNHDAGVNDIDKSIMTPLMYAAKNGHEEIVTLLIKKGAYIDAAIPFESGGIKAIDLAYNNGHSNIVEILSRNWLR